MNGDGLTIFTGALIAISCLWLVWEVIHAPRQVRCISCGRFAMFKGRTSRDAIKTARGFGWVKTRRGWLCDVCVKKTQDRYGVLNGIEP